MAESSGYSVFRGFNAQRQTIASASNVRCFYGDAMNWLLILPALQIALFLVAIHLEIGVGR